jgi:hypothetical protein
VAIHCAVLLVALRSVTRVNMDREESLVFLAPPDHAPASAPTAAARLLRHKKPAEPRDTHLLTVPAPAHPSPADTVAAPIDWNAEADLAVKRQALMATAVQPRALDKHGAGADLNGGLGPDGKKKPEFAWDRSNTHRAESLDGGGILIHINERCVIVLIVPFPFGACGIGKIPARGDLFDDMHAAPQLDDHPKNIAP